MKNQYLSRTQSALGAASVAILLALPSLRAADINKASNGTALNVGTSWVGGVAPTSSDVALWDSTVVAANTTVLGADLAFQGIRIADPGGAVIINTGSVLSLGSAGIDMSAATQNFSLRTNVALTSNQSWTVASGRTLEIGDNTLPSITGDFDVNLSGPGILSFRQAAPFTDAATNLVLSGGITLFGTGARNLTSEVTFAGSVGFGSAATNGGPIALQGSTVVNSGIHDVTLRDTVATDVAVNFTGASYSLSGPGTLRFLNGNASGVIRVSFGASGSATGSVSSDLTIGNNVRMVFGSSNQLTSAVDLTVEAGGFVTLNSNVGGTSGAPQTIGSLSGAGTVEYNRGSAGTVLLTIDGGIRSTTSTFSGVAQNGGVGDTLAITKTGSTTQVLSGPNTYTGQTRIDGGTLLINGTHIEAVSVTGNGYGSLTTGHFQVASGATFGGSGRISGNSSQTNSNMVLVQSGGMLTPGSAGIGTLTLDGVTMSGTVNRVLNMASGSSFAFNLAGDGGIPDRVDFWNYVTTDFLLNANAINFTLTGGPVAGTYTVDIFRFFSDSGSTATASGIGSGLTLGTLGADISSASIIYGTNAIQLQYTVVPEPSAFWAIGALLGGLAIWRARSRRRQSVN